MLALKRYEGQSITIGDNITVTINRIDARSVVVCIDAPKTVPILRTEKGPFDQSKRTIPDAAEDE